MGLKYQSIPLTVQIEGTRSTQRTWTRQVGTKRRKHTRATISPTTEPHVPSEKTGSFTHSAPTVRKVPLGHFMFIPVENRYPSITTPPPAVARTSYGTTCASTVSRLKASVVEPPSVTASLWLHQRWWQAGQSDRSPSRSPSASVSLRLHLTLR